MPKVTFVDQQREVSVPPGKTLLEASMRARVPLSSRCGGNGQCLTCKVIVADQNGLTPLADKEVRMLGDSLIDQGYRLACQCRVQGDTKVKLPESPLKAAIRAQLQTKSDDWD
jgi:2Fe-2S ferredoxin